MGLEVLFLLLPVAWFSGWLVGRRNSDGRAARDGCDTLSANYFKGLNFLLNEQPDKAIEVFIDLLENDSELVETHFALAQLFVRRGETDRAIRIHQNLIARPTLSRAQRNQALYELGRDYLRAGLLDRAESLFQELVDDPVHGQSALLQLLDIFQQEKEWEKAIGAATRLSSKSDVSMNRIIAHFHCELAEAALHQGDQGQVIRLLKKALSDDRLCVRATLLEGYLHLRDGNAKLAMRALHRVEQQDPDFLPEIIKPLQECYRLLGRPLEMLNYLRQVSHNHNSMSVVLAQADLIQQQQGDKDAAAFIISFLRKRPSVRGMARLIELKLQGNDNPVREDLLMLKDLTDKLLEGKPVYRCVNCGFTGKKLNWQCPSCKQWNVTKPIHGIEGD